MNKKAILYLRGKNKDLHNQRKRCEEVAVILKIKIDKEFWDDKNSSPINRSIFKKMLSYSKKNEISVWIVDEKKIIAPNKEDLLIILSELQKESIKIIFIKPILPFRSPLYFSDLAIDKIQDKSLMYAEEVEKILKNIK